MIYEGRPVVALALRAKHNVFYEITNKCENNNVKSGFVAVEICSETMGGNT